MSGTHIMQLLPALGDGGVERGTVEMAAYLAQKKIENWVVSAGGPLVELLPRQHTHHIAMKVGAKSPLAIISHARKLARLIDDNAIDIVHARSRAPAWVGYLACRWSRRPVKFFTTFHGVYSHGNRWKRRYNAVMLKGPIVVANSAFIRQHIIDVYGFPSENIIVSPRGVEPAQFDPSKISAEQKAAVRSELASNADNALAVIVGRITDWKGHRYLIEALDQCARKDVDLAIVGSGVQSVIDDLEALIKERDLSGRIRLLGSRRDIPAVMAAADLAVSSSIRPEAFGRVAIEAQAMATPIIATNHGGSLETVIDGETGFLVPPANPEAMARAIETALADPQRLARMGEIGRAHILAHFTTQTMLDQEFSAYERLLTMRP